MTDGALFVFNVALLSYCCCRCFVKAPLTKGDVPQQHSPGGCLQNHIIMYHLMVLHGGCRPCAAHDIATTT